MAYFSYFCDKPLKELEEVKAKILEIARERGFGTVEFVDERLGEYFYVESLDVKVPTTPWRRSKLVDIIESLDKGDVLILIALDPSHEDHSISGNYSYHTDLAELVVEKGIALYTFQKNSFGWEAFVRCVGLEDFPYTFYPSDNSDII